VKIRLIIIFTILSGLLYHCDSKPPTDSKRSNIETRKIQVKEIFRLTDLGINPEAMSFMHNGFFDVDADGNYYFLEFMNHRIVKCSREKEFVCQIGSIGQGEKDIYEPGAICIDGDSILVTYRLGKKIKRYSLNGEFISSFDIANCFQINTLRTHAGKIYCDARYSSDDWRKRNAISVFDAGGKLLAEIGKSLKTPDLFTYEFFNASYFQVGDKGITGAFKSSPVIFKYDADGRSIFYKDLGKMNIPEVDERLKIVSEDIYDTPEERKSADPDIIQGVFYSNGCIVENSGDIYYDFLSFSGAHVLLHFDSGGNLLEKLVLEKENRPVSIFGIYIKNTVRYGIGCVDAFRDNGMLFTF
jgi:hypothetical protein